MLKLLPTKLFHDAIDAYHNTPERKGIARKEAVWHYMLNGQTMLADYGSGYQPELIIHVKDTGNPLLDFEFCEVSEEYLEHVRQ